MSQDKIKKGTYKMTNSEETIRKIMEDKEFVKKELIFIKKYGFTRTNIEGDLFLVSLRNLIREHLEEAIKETKELYEKEINNFINNFYKILNEDKKIKEWFEFESKITEEIEKLKEQLNIQEKKNAPTGAMRSNTSLNEGSLTLLTKSPDLDLQEKLIKFEKYIKNLKGQIPFHVKKKVIFRFHEIFEKEMIGTETGDKWRKKVLR